MRLFPADHPLGREQRQHLREKLLPASDRDELVRLHGELILPALTKLLDAKVEELGARYERAWHGHFRNFNQTTDNKSPDPSPSRFSILQRFISAKTFECITSRLAHSAEVSRKTGMHG
jgi:hypothetical protein